MGFIKTDPLEFVKPESYESWMTRGIPRIGDVLFTTEAPLANVAQLDTEDRVVFAQRIIILQPNQSTLDSTFLKYLLLSDSTQKLILDKGTGATVKGIKASLLKKIDISYPSITEQKRIATILDEAFEGIAAATANAKKNLNNARALFQTELVALFIDRPRTRLLGDVAEVQSGGTPLISNKSFWGGTIPWYSSGELNDLLTKEPERHITPAGLNGSNAKLFPKGSLLIGMYDTAALKMSLLDRDGAFNQAIAGVKPNGNIDLTYALHSINAVKPEILSLRRGVRQKNLSLSKIKEIPIYVPELSEQKMIVGKLADLDSEVSSLEVVYQQKLAALTELKKSILNQAFTGQLH
jgi:type I restriction enzyme S subunit